MTPTPVVYTGPTPDDLPHIPAALTARPQWVLWQGADRIDTQTGAITGLDKIPINPHTLHKASTTNPATWGTFAQCVAALPVALEAWAQDDPGSYRGGGIGYVFAADDPYCGIDFDHCMDPETQAVDAWAQVHIEALQSYTEISQSRTGLHTLVQSTLPPKGRKKGGIELYTEGRFFTATGWHVPSTPATIEPRQEAVTRLHAQVFGATDASQDHTRRVTDVLDDALLLAKAREAKNSAKFLRLWEGDTSLHGGDESSADLALCDMLAFWTQDPAQIDRLFRQSGLLRDKWDARRGEQTYGTRTIQAALTLQTDHYHPPRTGPPSRNGRTPGPEPTNPFACPELPASAKVDDAWAAEASIFLDDYIAFSTKWAPRAYGGFHEAAALFVLSTTGARRIKIEFGPHGVYTSLYLALAARTSLFTKTTAVDIALALLRMAGLQPLLADDDATPQAFLRSLTLHVPQDYGEWPREAQEALKDRLAFAGQKGWFYEEWGQHLHAMMQKEGQMAAFRSILRRLDDHKDEYVYSTISRGRDVLLKPYVALLANVTPADLKPFLRAQSPLWRDGYIARFAFIAPGESTASTAMFPEGMMTIPRPLITTLASWHKRLGIPRIALDPLTDDKGKPTGRYQPVFAAPHRETTYVLSPEVRKAFYAYDEALHRLMAQSTQEDLDGSYARFPMKALRIAGLLASLHDDSSKYTIWPAQWYRGQQIAERWRADLHKLIKQVSEGDTETREGKGEQRILAILRKHGALSAMAIHKWTKFAHADILQYLEVLTKAEVVCVHDTGRTKKYAFAGVQPRTLEGDEV